MGRPPGAISGAPGKAQRSGFHGERSRSGSNALSPQVEASGLEHGATTRHPSRSKKLKDFLN